MAQTDAGAGGWGAGSGALSGAGAGAMVGTYIFPGVGTAIGAGVGALVGALGGAFAGISDNTAQREMERALQEEQDKIDKAQRNFDRSVAQSGDIAQEVLSQTMTSKNIADQAKADRVMGEASQAADSAGLIGAEKADYISKERQRTEMAIQASNPQVYQAAVAGAENIRAQEINKGAMELQSEQQQSQAEMERISGQQLPDASGAWGQALGSVAQIAGAKGMIDAQGAGGGGGKGALGGAPSTAKTGGMTGAEVASYGDLVPPSMIDPYSHVNTMPGATGASTMSQPGMQADTLPTDFTGSNLGGNVPVVSGGQRLGGAATPDALAVDGAATTEQADVLAQQTSQMGGPEMFLGGSVAGAATPAPTPTPTPTPTPAPTPAPTPTPAPAPAPARTLSADFGTQAMRDPFGGDLSSAPAVTPTPAVTDPKVLQPGHYWQEQPNGGYMQVPYGTTTPLASGGMAGATGPEVALLGEEGPELVLNAKQTQGLAQALGGAKALASGGVAGADEKKMKGYDEGGVAGLQAEIYAKQAEIQSKNAEQQRLEADKLAEIRASLSKDYWNNFQRGQAYQQRQMDDYYNVTPDGYPWRLNWGSSSPPPESGQTIRSRGAENLDQFAMGRAETLQPWLGKVALEREQWSPQTGREEKLGQAESRMQDPTLRGGGQFTTPIPPVPYRDIEKPEEEMSAEELLEYLRTMKQQMTGAL